MIGQAVSTLGKKYNVIILAGGSGTRMGEQSDYIPKALSQIGNKRAIDHIIERYLGIAHKLIIGTCTHADILEAYIKGRFPVSNIEFSRETELHNNAHSTLYALDHADSRYGTIIVFCDLIVVSNQIVRDDTILVVDKDTRGKVGTFRHTDRFGRGILGNFIFSNTYLLKSIAYSNFYSMNFEDLTENIVMEYSRSIPMNTEVCEVVYEFGTENDLEEVRKLWESA